METRRDPSERRRRVFVASMADVFERWDGQMNLHTGNFAWFYSNRPHEYIPFPPPEDEIESDTIGAGTLKPVHMRNIRARLGGLIRRCTSLDFLLLSKRHEEAPEALKEMFETEIPANAWIGFTVESQKRTDRIRALKQIEARTRFISVEPMQERVDLGDLSGIHWVIFGGESGPLARPCDPDWIQNGVEQCRRQGVAVFVKQLGSRWKPSRQDPSGTDMSRWPQDLCVQEAPSESRLIALNRMHA